MKNTFTVIIISFLLLAACDNSDNAGNLNSNSLPTDSITYIDYSADGPAVSQFLGWQWAKGGSEFKWMFKNDGTVSVIHCCGDLFIKQFSYLFRGNILITYGSEESSDELEATDFTMTEDGVSFTRSNGISFTKGESDTDSLPASPLVLSNDMLGTWQEADGTKYEFCSNAELHITSPSGNVEQYGYLVRYSALLTLGPLVDGEQAGLRQYRFSKKNNKLYLRLDDVDIILNRL